MVQPTIQSSLSCISVSGVGVAYRCFTARRLASYNSSDVHTNRISSLVRVSWSVNRLKGGSWLLPLALIRGGMPNNYVTVPSGMILTHAKHCSLPKDQRTRG